MLFNSFAFIVFWIVVIMILLVGRKITNSVRIHNIILLLASYVFYGCFNVSFLLILIFVTLVNYATAKYLFKTEKKSKMILGAGVLLSLFPLLFYKYAAFIVNNILLLTGNTLPTNSLVEWIMPIGISFFTFQALSYTIDIYRRKITEECSLTEFMLFVAFFPTVLSGPIERARNLIPQFRTHRRISTGNFTDGITIFIWGLFKKIVIADRLCAYVNWVYADAESQTGASLAIAAIFYSIQIYCDFSGYSDMAWGVAKSLGFDITRNFRFPYFACTIKEFWRRWHISLTSWFTEYVYFSLGGNRVRLKVHWIFNISMVFLLSGIWHGASWNFLLWGALHAVYYLIEYACGIHQKGYQISRWLKFPAMLMVFALVTLAWIFFRIEDFHTAAYIIAKILVDIMSPIAVGSSAFTFVCNMFLLVLFGIFEFLMYRRGVIDASGVSRYTSINVAWVVSLLLMLSMFSVSTDSFVYFQF